MHQRIGLYLVSACNGRDESIRELDRPWKPPGYPPCAIGGAELGIKEFFLKPQMPISQSPVYAFLLCSNSLRLSSQQPLSGRPMPLSLSVLLESVLHRNGFVHQMLIVERLQSRI